MRTLAAGIVIMAFAGAVTVMTQNSRPIGDERAMPHHLHDGEELTMPVRDLLAYGRELFTAIWTSEDGGGRPLAKGTGAALSDPARPLVFPRNFNRVSGPEANSCAGCHAQPYGIPGGSGDIVSNVFVEAHRFDFATFDSHEATPTESALDERGVSVTLQSIADSRSTIGMFGSGFIEMLARQMTEDLQAIRDATPFGGVLALRSKGVEFGTIARGLDGSWLTSGVEGLAPPSLVTSGPSDPPSLVIRPFQQSGSVISLREFTNNAFNDHHGMQSTERFGQNTDPDGDGIANELTRADITAVTLYQATMAVPGRVIPDDPDIETAVLVGESKFRQIGCANCHRPSLPLDRRGWIFTEPNPFNAPGNLQLGDAPTLAVDLTRHDLPDPRLSAHAGIVEVPAFTDLKLHDITSGPNDPNREALDMNQPAGSPEFFAGNGRFLTRALWGAANQPPFCHHGQFTTLREAVLAHAGEALTARRRFSELSPYQQDSMIEFLKTLQVLPPGTTHLIVDERGRPKAWPPRGHRSSKASADAPGGR